MAAFKQVEAGLKPCANHEAICCDDEVDSV